MLSGHVGIQTAGTYSASKALLRETPSVTPFDGKMCFAAGVRYFLVPNEGDAASSVFDGRKSVHLAVHKWPYQGGCERLEG